jgi:hypothetical protein
LTNEKRGGLSDRSCFKLFSLLFSNKSLQAPSGERHKTAQQTLFLLFANNNCFPTPDEKLLALFEKINEGKPSSQIWGRMYNTVVSIKCMM